VTVVESQPSLSLAGLTDERGARERIEWAAGLGYRAVQLDGALLRARELDRSARRDLASLLRRLELGFSGIDLWIPPAHFVETGHVDRAVAAVVGAVELAAELARLLGCGGGVVCVTMPEKTSAATVGAVLDAALRVGASVADCSWPFRAAEGPLGVGIDPAVLLMAGKDPAAEVARLASVPLAARASDAAAGGRVVMGSGSLDVLAYKVALSVKGFGGPLVVDLRGVRDQEAAAARALEAVG
jgi:sugar phosphate isomerase/epimerase